MIGRLSPSERGSPAPPRPANGRWHPTERNSVRACKIDLLTLLSANRRIFSGSDESRCCWLLQEGGIHNSPIIPPASSHKAVTGVARVRPEHARLLLACGSEVHDFTIMGMLVMSAGSLKNHASRKNDWLPQPLSMDTTQAAVGRSVILGVPDFDPSAVF